MYKSDTIHSFQPAFLQFVQPSREWLPIVRHFWGVKASFESAISQNVYPDGSWGLCFNFCQPLHYASNRNPIFFMDALQSCRQQVILVGELDVFGVRFWPGQALDLLPQPPLQLGQERLDLLALDPFWQDLIHELANQNTTEGRAQKFEIWLGGRFVKQNKKDYVAWAHQRIWRHHGRINISELAGEIGVSPRTLERQFRERTGFSPKKHARFQRILFARRLLKTAPSLALAEIALAAGYHDQAHFSKDFQTVVGRSPLQYRSG
ncbi:MAG: AraC family transcriptional regulator [Acidobacteria bacterium]|nr:AraC family transcriptional regulator [Acidobacteriota bacterium]